MAQEGGDGSPRRPLRRASWARRSDRWFELQAVRGPDHVPEPPFIQEVIGPGRGRVWVHKHRPISHPLRRVTFSRHSNLLGPNPTHCQKL